MRKQLIIVCLCAVPVFFAVPAGRARAEEPPKVIKHTKTDELNDMSNWADVSGFGHVECRDGMAVMSLPAGCFSARAKWTGSTDTVEEPEDEDEKVEVWANVDLSEGGALGSVRSASVLIKRGGKYARTEICAYRERVGSQRQMLRLTVFCDGQADSTRWESPSHTGKLELVCDHTAGTITATYDTSTSLSLSVALPGKDTEPDFFIELGGFTAEPLSADPRITTVEILYELPKVEP